MKLIIGLGNPDGQYQNTRHNLGHQVVLSLIKDKGLRLAHHPKLQAKIAQKGTGDQKILYALTTTYMNESGLAIKKVANFFKVYSNEIFIVHDDLDLPIGEYRVQFDRGPAGHKGVLSAINFLGTRQFFRIRLGIGHPPAHIPVEDYVLLPFTSKEQGIIQSVIDQISKDIDSILNSSL